jgi:hypothetical protein
MVAQERDEGGCGAGGRRGRAAQVSKFGSKSRGSLSRMCLGKALQGDLRDGVDCDGQCSQPEGASSAHPMKEYAYAQRSAKDSC